MTDMVVDARVFVGLAAEILIELPQLMKLRREELGWSQRRLAQELHRWQSEICEWETRKNSMTVDTAIFILEWLATDYTPREAENAHPSDLPEPTRLEHGDRTPAQVRRGRVAAAAPAAAHPTPQALAGRVGPEHADRGGVDPAEHPGDPDHPRGRADDRDRPGLSDVRRLLARGTE